MQIASYNINGINARLELLTAWLKTAKPDIVCLQEVKTPDLRFPAQALRRAGYESVWATTGQYNGVAILARGRTPKLIRAALPGDPKDIQPRYIEAEIDGVTVASIYLPNGNPRPGPMFDYKNAWFTRLLRHAQGLLKSGRPVILAGDYNVVPSDGVRDIYATKGWEKDALLQPEPRAAYAKLLKQGWTDALAAKGPKKPTYTFWTYWRLRYETDHGLRIDHLLLSPDLVPRLAKAGVDRAVRGLPKSSDHAPVWMQLKKS